MNEVNNNENVSQVTTTPVAPVTPTTPPVQPVQEVVASPQPVASPAAPVASSSATNVPEISAPPASTITSPEVTKESEKVEEPTNNVVSNEAETDGKLRFPLVVVLLLSVVVIFLFVYYFVLITPKNLFAKALKTQINAMTSGILYKDKEYKTESYLIDSKFEASEDGIVSFLNNLEYKFSINHDIENGNYAFKILSNIDSLDTSDKIEHNQNINSSFYYYDRSLYYKFSDDVLKTDTHGDSTDNTQEFIDLFNTAAYELIDSIDISKVKRTIQTKKVKDYSLLAIRFSTEFNNDELNKMWQLTIDNVLDNSKNPDFVKKFADNLDITEEQAIDTLKNFKKYIISAKNVKLDYYLNLACNNLVAFELKVDDIVFSMSYLSGYYFLDIDTNGVDIDFSYNFKTSDFEGELVLDNETTYSVIDFESITNLNDNYEKIGNNLNINFYREETKGSSTKSDKPYLSIKSVITYDYDKDIEFFDPLRVIPLENASVEDIAKLAYMTNKIKYELFYLIGLNTVNRTEMTPRMYAETLLNSMGESIIVPETPIAPPVVDEPNGDSVEPELSVPETNNQDDVVQNVSTQSE